MQEAIDAGADAFFDEKYGDTVRTVRVQDYSFELCGGTHCRATGQIGGFVITGERSIGSGQRRIEAVTGATADAYARERLDALERVAEAVGAQTLDAVEERVTHLQAELARARKQARSGTLEPSVNLRERIGDIDLLLYAAPYPSVDDMKAAARDLRAANAGALIAVGMDADEPHVFVTVPEHLVVRGIAAGDLVRAAMPAIEGKGGGRPEMAQGRGTKREGIQAAMAAIRAAIETRA
jgi:alanyl-tRNA synthetase